MEAIAFATICFILAPKGSPILHRLKKGAGGAILYIALFQSYHILRPLLPTELGYLLHSAIWGALFAYATPNLPLRNSSTDEGKKEQGDNRQHDEEKKEHRSPKVGVQEGTPPTSTLT
jgi:hypothetical protein